MSEVISNTKRTEEGPEPGDLGKAGSLVAGGRGAPGYRAALLKLKSPSEDVGP